MFIHLREPSAAPDLGICALNPVAFHDFRDTLPQAFQAREVAQDVKRQGLLSSQPLDELVDIRIAAHSFRALKRHDKEVRWKDGVLHDGRNLIRAVDHHEVKLINNLTEQTG